MAGECEYPVGFVVYAISDGDEFHKIGVAVNVEKRIKQLQTGNPRKLILSAFVRCKSQTQAYLIESAAKRSLAEFKAVGEWFRCSSFYALQSLYEGASELGHNEEPVVVRIVTED